jgi:hypothetical protein
VWLRVSPAITPRALASYSGVRSPAKYGSTTSPLAPGGVSVACSMSCSNDHPSERWPRTHLVSAPEVAAAPSMAWAPGKTPGVLHRSALGTDSVSTPMMASVVPYINMMSPGSLTPTLADSA